MKKYLQLYIGGVSGRNLSSREIERKLELASLEKNDGIIVGWSLDREIYRWLREYTKLHQVEYYLWFQVFSEYKSLKNFTPICDVDGNETKSMLFDQDEEFFFYCPSNPNTVSYLKEIYEENFQEFGFDGVFLDRIRFPSLAFDKKALFSCCCDTCMKKYEKSGITKKMIRELEKYVETQKKQDNMLDIIDYQDGIYNYKTKELKDYLTVRTTLITDVVRELSDYFREKEMKIGLDLFAPFLAEFVGQNYKELSAYADFIKPMLYRFTDTPAGMNFELKGLISAMSEEETAEERQKQFNVKIHKENSEISDFMMQEVQNALSMTSCEVLVGMEIHTIPENPSISVTQIKEGIERLEETKISGRIASWNILAAEDESIQAFMGRR